MLKRSAVFYSALLIALFILSSTGLFAQNQDWQQTNGPCGGVLYDVAESPDGNIFVLSAASIYVSSDKGSSWHQTNFTRNLYYGGFLYVSSKGVIFANENGYIHKSSDKGNSWSKIQVSDYDLTLFTSDTKGNVFTSDGNSIYLSTNDGSSWIKRYSFSPDIKVNGMSVTLGNNYFAATNKGLFHSIDNGYTWTLANLNLSQTEVGSVLLTKQGSLFIGTAGKISMSTDLGATWRDSYINSDYYYSNYLFKSIVSDSAGNLWADNTGELLKSTDNGINWNKISYKPGYYNWFKKFLAAKDGSLYAATNNGLLISKDNAASWNTSTNGIISTDNKSIFTASDGTMFAVNEIGIFTSTDQGNNWNRTNADSISGNGFTGGMIEDKTGKIYAGSWESVLITQDHGKTWTKVPLGTYNSSYARAFVLGRNGEIFTATQYGILSSTDSGKSWKLLYTWPSASTECALAANKNGDILAALDNGVYRSSDDGKSWSRISPSGIGDLNSILINRKGYIFAGQNGGGFAYTYDNGNTWYHSPIDGRNFYAGSFLEDASGRIYINNSTYLYYSDNDGTNWSIFDDMYLRNFEINKIYIDKKGYLVAASRSKGVFRSKDPMLKILPPDKLVIKPGDQKAALCWSKSSSQNFSQYNIYGSTGHYPTALLSSSTGGVMDTSKVITGLLNDKPYYFVVSAVDNSGNESFSDEVSVIPQPAPLSPKLASVQNNSVKCPISKLVLKWNKSKYADTYHFQLACDSLFNTTVVLADSSLQDTTKELPLLKNSTKYYWRVKARGISGQSPWSEIWSFTTIIAAPAAPVAIEPAPNSVNQPVNQTFKWMKLPAAEQYHFQLSKLQDFSVLTVEDSTMTDTLKIINGLKNDTKYYWRVKASNEGGVSPWMDSWYFTTIVAMPDVPVLSYPLNNALNIPTDCTIKWISAARAEKYHLQAALDSLFAVMAFEDSLIADTSKKLISLTYDTKFFWRVRAKNIGGISQWSAVSSFKVVKQIPNAPVLNCPVNNSQDQPLNISLKWNKLTLAESYHIQLSEKQDFTSFVINDSTLTDTLKQSITLKNNTKYYWRLRAKNNGGTGQWSESWSFTTIVAMPGIPVLSYPANNSKNIAKDVKLVWASVQDAASYRLQAAEDSLFAVRAIDDSAITQASMDVSLKSGMKYYWRVNARNIAGISNYSQVWNFITQLPAAEGLTTTAITAWVVKLQWTDKSDNETGFKLERKSDKEAVYTVRAVLNANAAAYTDSTTPNTTYKYRIKAFNQLIESDYSTEITVLTPAASSVDKTAEVPVEYSLKQNYPNPFNPSTVIKYSLLSESHVKLCVYNSIGALVEVSVNKIQSAGVYEQRFNAESLSSGIYYYSITIQSTDGKDNYRSVKKMLLIK